MMDVCQLCWTNSAKTHIHPPQYDPKVDSWQWVHMVLLLFHQLLYNYWLIIIVLWHWCTAGKKKTCIDVRWIHIPHRLLKRLTYICRKISLNTMLNCVTLILCFFLIQHTVFPDFRLCVCMCVCISVWFCKRYILSTKILFPLAKWGHFWEVRSSGDG